MPYSPLLLSLSLSLWFVELLSGSAYCVPAYEKHGEECNSFDTVVNTLIRRLPSLLPFLLYFFQTTISLFFFVLLDWTFFTALILAMLLPRRRV